MSVPRVLLVPTHHTGLANAVAAAVAEVATAQGQRVRYHHLGPLSPVSSWDRWEGAAFLDPALHGEEALLALYDVATRGAHLSLLSSSGGLLDRREGVDWLPTDVARLLDCPIVVVMDCRGWGTGIRALVSGLKSRLAGLNLAGAVLSGVADRDHREMLRRVLTDENVPVVGCLFEGDGPGWDATPPGAWGLPLETTLLEAVSRQVDISGLEALAGQRGFLSSQNWLIDRGIGGPLVLVAGGRGFTPWSRDSIEVLRSAGAQVRRLDLVEDSALPAETAGLVLAGTVWPADLPDISMNQPLLRDMRARISGGLPTVALGGGALILLSKIQDSLGRTVELADVLPAEGEVLWELEEPAYVEVTAERDSVLLVRGETVTGWVVTDFEMVNRDAGRDAPLTVRGVGELDRQAEGAATSSLLCSRVLVHLAATPDMAPRFVRQCAAYAASRSGPSRG
jgi:cobyrinic acid a,c-diamide synthase